MIEAIRLTGQVRRGTRSASIYDYQKVCNGSAYAKGGEQCRDRGDDWVALGSVGAGFFGALAPESGNVWDDREKITQASGRRRSRTSCCSRRASPSSPAGSAARFRAAR